MKLLHIINDEKFVNAVINQFDIAEDQQSYYLLPVSNFSNAKYLNDKFKTHQNIYFNLYGTTDYFSCIDKINPDFLIIHGLSNKHKFILKKLDNKFKVVWNSWGRDIFSMKKLNHRMYKAETRTIITETEKSQNTYKRKIGKLFYWFLLKERRIQYDTENFLKYIDFISTVVKEDYYALKEAYPETDKIKYLNFNYGVVNFDKTEFTQGKDIIVGNSANPENNHIESFNLLNNSDLKDKKIVVPLSYGGNQHYIKKIIESGENLFGAHFKPLNTFLKKVEYENILDNIGVAIMNQSHQHAMGNIIYLLSNGVKVYMDYNNTAAKYLLRIGAKIFNVETEIDFSPLSKKEKDNNKLIMIKHYDTQAIKKRTQNYVDRLIIELKKS